MILAPKGMKKLLHIKNTRYDLRGTDILKLKLKPKVNTTTYRHFQVESATRVTHNC